MTRHAAVLGIATAAVVASLVPTTASSAATAITVSKTSGLTNGETVQVSASGFATGPGSIIQCNTTPGQPEYDVAGTKVPVGCTDPLAKLVIFDASGNLAATAFTVKTGTLGIAAQSADYPCPPTAAQATAGATCVIAVGDVTKANAQQVITFAGAGTTTTTAPAATTTTQPGATTTTSATSTTSSTSTTTTTTTTSTTTTSAASSPAIAASPSTNLAAGMDVAVSGARFTPGATIAIVECSPLAAAPGVTEAQAQRLCDVGHAVLATADTAGSIRATFKIAATGAAAPADFRAADPAAACPPPAGQASCFIAAANVVKTTERAVTNIAFATQVATATAAGPGTPGARVLGAQVTNPAGSGGSLARTGAQRTLLLAGVALALIDLGWLASSATRPARRRSRAWRARG